ncbi:MAG: ribosome small subunit-dependent GTPase A [Hydrogenovibrio sp.]
MAKRKLNQHQQRRVHQKQARQTTAAPNDGDHSALGEKQPGLVITNFGKRLLVEGDDGQVYNCAVRQHLGKLVAGDRVRWQTDREPHSGVVIAVEPRHQELSRPGFRGQKRMVAANIDLLVIVTPIEPGVHPDMIDRYLVTAHQMQLPVLILINKIDLIDSDEHWEAIAELLLPYDELGLEILPVSADSGDGLDELKTFLTAKNSVFVGPSGAGKSSLIQTLIPDIDIKTSELSESTGLGKHTTTNSILYHLPVDKTEPLGSAGNIIDSPGVRQFSPAPCELHELEAAYPDFAPYLGQCKFNNCTHTTEPDCAIRQAVEADAIHFSRYQSFQRLREEFAAAAR